MTRHECKTAASFKGLLRSHLSHILDVPTSAKGQRSLVLYSGLIITKRHERNTRFFCSIPAAMWLAINSVCVFGIPKLPVPSRFPTKIPQKGHRGIPLPLRLLAILPSRTRSQVPFPIPRHLPFRRYHAPLMLARLSERCSDQHSYGVLIFSHGFMAPTFH
jgi:hypothetical protein